MARDRYRTSGLLTCLAGLVFDCRLKGRPLPYAAMHIPKSLIGAGLALAALASSATAAQAAVVIESDTTRQAENSPPLDNWVTYTRVGTPSTAAAFVTGPASSTGAGSLKLTT